MILRTLTAALAASSLLRAGEATHQWKAKWIDCPQSDPQAFGVYHFRKAFELPARPEHLVIFVSADNR
ncbi:MAG: alpha-L-rhamnosidase, partial [Bryobacterales bacterium]|nr:alpha-L-rhamnosidase [Bryobacterales bacterium]